MEEQFESIHCWFGLSYANYLVLPRSLLQSMPQEWQSKFVDMIDEISETLETPYELPEYRVNAVDEKGRFIKDDYREYRHQQFTKKAGN